MLNCKDASQLISQSLDRSLSWSERFKLRVHLFMCKACTRFNQQLHQLRSAIKKMMQHTESDMSIQLTPEAKERIIERLNH